jgi:hypothetical protein
MGNQIVEFYSGKGNDHCGRSFDTILEFSDSELESVHDYIQWLFPMKGCSPVNPVAPVVDKQVQAEFAENPTLKTNLCKACGRMLKFYGLRCDTGMYPCRHIGCDANFTTKAANWLIPSNHNHFRLTRILTSLRLLGLKVCSRNLLVCLVGIASRFHERITRETLAYWKKSQGRCGWMRSY